MESWIRPYLFLKFLNFIQESRSWCVCFCFIDIQCLLVWLIDYILYDVNLTGRIVWYRLRRFGWRHFRWRKISQGRRHFRWRKISLGRRHKDYLDKSEIGSTRNSKRNSHQILWKCQKCLYWKQKQILIVYLNKKIKIDMGLLNSLGQNYNKNKL